MIEDWAESCHTAGCNFIVEEYHELAISKGYQVAINAKPLFIKKALETASNAGLNGVVYIDGDMTINKYPHIFDMENVDFMARGWNIDPRSARGYLDDKTCFDPWTFETSGGIMYFGNTPGGHAILDAWIRATNRPVHSGKADDRIISLIFNFLEMFTPNNIIQLPIEYLWLTDIYGTRINDDDKRAKKRKKDNRNECVEEETGFVNVADAGPVIVEHPACLTSEEKAADQGASGNRSTILYTNYIENRIDCDTNKKKYIFYEYIFFDGIFNPKNILNPENIAATLGYEKYNKYMNTNELYYNVPYEHEYNYFNDNANTNNIALRVALSKNNHLFQPDKKQNCYVIFESNIMNNVANILSKLDIGYNVVYIPDSCELHTRDNVENVKKSIIKYLNQISSTCEFAANRTGESDFKTRYTPIFDYTKPIFFSHKSKVLRHLLLMCKNISTKDSTIQVEKMNFTTWKPIVPMEIINVHADLNSIFNSSFIFLTRIRCEFLEE